MMRTREYNNEWVENRPEGFSLVLLDYFHNRMLRKAIEVIPNLKAMRILEVGVGFGFFARAVKKAGIEYAGIEMNERLAAEMKVTCAIVPPFPDGLQADVIWLSHVIEHCSSYLEARDFIEQVFLTLKPGGHIVIIGPDILSWKFEFWNDSWSHGYPTSIRNCTQMLNDAGFSVIFKGHHTAAVFQPLLQFILSVIMRFIPHRLLDLIVKPVTGKTLFYSFMTIFGWRQIYLIGRKER